MSNPYEFKPMNGWKYMSCEDKKECFDFAEGYKEFLNTCKTEREVTAYLLKTVKDAGFVDFAEIINNNGEVKPGMKIYLNNRGKSFVFAVIGSDCPCKGLRMIGAHIDSPRLDFKPHPFYDDCNITLAKTHYYGGIKKFQWVSIPLAIHGFAIKADGTPVNIVIGEDESDPVFYISDILPHLGKDQMEKTMAKAITGEQLNVILSHIPLYDGEGDDVKPSYKDALLNILYEKYGLTEKEFIGAEIEVVPSFKARDIGFDRGLVGAYGHDDRVCAYAQLRALMSIKGTPVKTSICYFTDKEEIGSVGTTGADTVNLDNFVLELCHAIDKKLGIVESRRALSNSEFLSADVTAAVDPSFLEAFDRDNDSYLANGIAFCKVTGARGKSGASDAPTELVYKITSVLDKNNIPWQLTEMGKVDQGGGGTIALDIARYNVNTIDCGVPLLAMHSPYEVASKADIYWSYRAYKAFLEY